MSNSTATYESAETEYVVVNGYRIAYRRLGPQDGVPLLHLLHFGGTMDHVDPAVANGLAATRPVILFDAPGIGHSEGQVPCSFREAARDCADFMAALGITKIDVFGFSMGGCVAQMLALNHPKLVRRLILVGTMPSIGRGVTPPPARPFTAYRRARTFLEHREAFIDFSFHPCEKSQRAARESWARVVASRPNRIVDVGKTATREQLTSFAKFMKPEFAHEGSFNRLHELKIPVLLVKGSRDVALDDGTFQVMIRRMSNADVRYHVFPDSGHACHFQYPDEFVHLAAVFLDQETVIARDNSMGMSPRL